VFHSVVVVTDRRVLDQQLQNTIYQFEHKTGVVEKIDENTQQLARALSQGTPIVITTIQKFPFISQALSTSGEEGLWRADRHGGQALCGHRRRGALVPERRDRDGAQRHAEQGRDRGCDRRSALRWRKWRAGTCPKTPRRRRCAMR
jgi:hypothetical protein